MAWAVLFAAGLLEVGWAIGLKYTEGFTRLTPSVLTLAAMAGSIILLGLALKTLPIGTAYAVWTGIGAVGTALLGIWLLGEPATALRLACIGLIVAGLMEIGWAIGLKYTEGFTRLVPSVLTLTSMAASIILLGLALKTLPIGTAYAVWTGIGAVGTAILGIALFGEPATAARLASIGLIVSGIIGLKLVT